jgi:O-antigen/teichoic acid export membrane protein
MTVLTTPYNAAIIAREKMNVYAYVSIVDTVLKLLIVYFLALFAFDKLKLYAILTFAVTTVVTFIYRTYCQRKFEECCFSFYWDKKRIKEILSFAWWNMIGAIANILQRQGINILLNIFFNPIVNAAQAIAHQVSSALTNFTNNFHTAVRPQITKSFSSGNIKEMHDLIYRSSKIAFYLMMILSIPLLIKTKYILSLWLTNVPEHTITFVRLLTINVLLEVFSQPLVAGIQAVGNLKKYQTTVSLIYLMSLPISYFLLKAGFSPQSPLIVSFILIVASFIPRIIICKQITGISIREYSIEIFASGIFMFFIVTSFSYCMSKILPSDLSGLFILILFEFVFSSIVLSVFYLSKTEKKHLLNFIYHVRGSKKNIFKM